MIDVNNFHYMKIGLASPEKFALGLMVKLRNLKQLITVHLNLKKMVFSVKEFLDLLKIGNVVVVEYKRVRYKGMVCDRCGVE